MKIYSPTPIRDMNIDQLKEELTIRCSEPFWDERHGDAIRERIDAIYRIAEKRGWEI